MDQFGRPFALAMNTEIAATSTYGTMTISLTAPCAVTRHTSPHRMRDIRSTPSAHATFRASVTAARYGAMGCVSRPVLRRSGSGSKLGARQLLPPHGALPAAL